MKGKITKLVITGVIIFLFTSAPVIWAEEGGTPPQASTKQKMKHKEKGFAKDLNLTHEQQEKMKQHREANQEKKKQLRELMQAKRAELKAEIGKPALDSAKVYALASEIKSLFGQMLDLRIEGLLFMKQTLTPEQFEKFQKKINERKSEWREKKYHHKSQEDFKGKDDEGGIL